VSKQTSQKDDFIPPQRRFGKEEQNDEIRICDAHFNGL
jgi:hypothetical protein